MESRCPSAQTPRSFWTSGHKKFLLRLQTSPEPRMSSESQINTLIECTDDAMEKCCELKRLKSKDLPELVGSDDSTNVTCNQTLSMSECGKDIRCDGHFIDNHIPVRDQCVPSEINSVPKSSELCHTTCTLSSQQKPTGNTGTVLPSIVPTYFKAATKKEQYRKMKHYQHNVLRHPHALIGSGCEIFAAPS